jgi:GT2 family glycosyltransferase
VNEPSVPRVAISMLNWNGWQETIKCLDSIRAGDYSNYLTVVVDNGSIDDSRGKIREWAARRLNNPDSFVEYSREVAEGGGDEQTEAVLDHAEPANRLVLISLSENRGFTGGHNVAIRYALSRRQPADYVLLLNNDTEVARDCLAQLVAVDQLADAGIVGAAVYSADGQSSQFSGRTTLRRMLFRPIVRWELPPPETGNCFWETFTVHGAAMMIRNDTLQAIHGPHGEYLDERLFAHWDETALCFAAKRKGFKTVMAKNAVVYHQTAKSCGGVYNPLSYYYIVRNRTWLAGELLPLRWTILFHLVNVPLCAARILYNLYHGRPRSARAVLLGVVDGYRDVTGKWKYHDQEAFG